MTLDRLLRYSLSERLMHSLSAIAYIYLGGRRQ